MTQKPSAVSSLPMFHKYNPIHPSSIFMKLLQPMQNINFLLFLLILTITKVFCIHNEMSYTRRLSDSQHAEYFKFQFLESGKRHEKSRKKSESAQERLGRRKRNRGKIFCRALVPEAPPGICARIALPAGLKTSTRNTATAEALICKRSALTLSLSLPRSFSTRPFASPEQFAFPPALFLVSLPPPFFSFLRKRKRKWQRFSQWHEILQAPARVLLKGEQSSVVTCLLYYE